VFTSYLIAFFLQRFGAPGVFSPRTDGRALEEIAH
jgi:hypothetical protein